MKTDRNINDGFSRPKDWTEHDELVRNALIEQVRRDRIRKEQEAERQRMETLSLMNAKGSL